VIATKGLSNPMSLTIKEVKILAASVLSQGVDTPKSRKKK
jgi:hypothetical protein